MSRRALLAGWTIVVAATVAAVLAIHGTGEEGLRAAIRTAARFSALAIACAVAGIRTREFLIALPVSHAIHYAAIAALSLVTAPANAGADAITVPVGAAIFTLMLYAAVRGARWAMWLLWAILLYAIAVRAHTSWIYPPIVLMLLGAAVRRFVAGRPATIPDRVAASPK